jgi:hypothetical protein
LLKLDRNPANRSLREQTGNQRGISGGARPLFEESRNNVTAASVSGSGRVFNNCLLVGQPRVKVPSTHHTKFQPEPKNETAMVQFLHQFKTKRRFPKLADLFHELSVIHKIVSLKHYETNPATAYPQQNLPALKSAHILIPISVNELNPRVDFLRNLSNDFK